MRKFATQKNNEKKVIILDASAFIAGYDPFSVSYRQYSVPAVREELQRDSLSRLRFETASERGRLKVLKPTQPFIDKAKKVSMEVGDITFLSKADLEILALALQLRDSGFSPSIVTDDYSIQNVAEKVKISFTPLATFGIRFQHEWLVYCPACHKRYPPNYDSTICEACGIPLKRKPLKRTKIKKSQDNSLF